jgi:hypothetical protein
MYEAELHSKVMTAAAAVELIPAVARSRWEWR